MSRIALRGVVITLIVSACAAQPLEQPDRQRRRSPIVEVFENSRDAVVNISTTRTVQMRSLGVPSLWDDIFDFGPPRRWNREVQSIGSGVVVHPSGYIVTNAHVVAQASDVRVNFPHGPTEPAEILAVDSEHDLAVLKINASQPLPAQKLGRSDDLMVGETVVAIGNPLGLQFTVTAGIVSALDRSLDFGDERVYRGLIQTDASINPGNSGGPLLNVNGELIGINTAIRGDAQNIGFAIPVDRLWELLPVMLDIERRERVKFGLRVGGPHAEVLDVRAGSPAAESDLKPGDRVVEFNGEPIRDGIDYYVHLLGQKPGERVNLAVRRAGGLRQVSVPLQAIPLPEGRKLAQRLLGLDLGDVPDRICRRYDLPAHVGLIVTDVEHGSPADRAGVLVGDIILRLDRVTTANLKILGLILEQVTPGDRVVVEGLRLEAQRPFIWDPVSIKTRR